MLLILKAEVHRATSMDGKPYDQPLLTFVRSYDLGDRDDRTVNVPPRLGATSSDNRLR
jgi:hypothetical protein